MMYQCRRVLGLTALMMQIKWEPVAANGVPEFAVRVHDGFGNDTVGLMYYGAMVEFRCRCHVNECRDKNRTLDLTIDGQPLLSSKNYHIDEVTPFHVNIDDNFKLGSYGCRIENRDIGDQINISYYLCRDDEPKCDKQWCCNNQPKNCPERLCIMRQPVPSFCSLLQWLECDFHKEERICQGTNINPPSPSVSMCHALANNDLLVPLATTRYACPGSEIIHFMDNAGWIALGSYYHYHSGSQTNLTLRCMSTQTDFGPIRITEKGIGEDVIVWSDEIRCNQPIPFEKHEHSRSKVWGVKTKLVADGGPRTAITSTYIYIISLELVLEFNLPKGPCEPQTVRNFTCAIKIPSEVPNGSLRKFTSLWFNKSHVGEVEGQNAFRNFNAVLPGEYGCSGWIEHRTCSPSSQYSFEKHEWVDLHQSCLLQEIPTITSIAMKETTEASSSPAVLYTLIGLFLLLVFFTSIALFLIYYRKWKLAETNDGKATLSQKSTGSKIQTSSGSTSRVDVFRSSKKDNKMKMDKQSQKLSQLVLMTDTSGAKKSSKEQPLKAFKAGKCSDTKSKSISQSELSYDVEKH